MLRTLADENFNYDILHGMRLRNPSVDVVRVQDVGLVAASDPVILEWAASEGRIILTHDVRTMTHYAYERVRIGLPMPGVLEISQRVSVGQAIEELLLVIECGLPGEYENQVRYLPL
jgi:hypothetical protein